MPGRSPKEFQEYLVNPTDAHVGHNSYIESPATAFLKYTVEAKDAINHCVKKFPRLGNGSFGKDSRDSLQYLVVATLPAIMGHFETYQRYLFAGAFDYSIYLRGFNVDSFFKSLGKDFTIDLVRLSAYRGDGISSIGALLADNLQGWQNPFTVNQYFKAFGCGHDFYSEDARKQIIVLWQLRHSIVHTGGTLTLADSQKIDALRTYGDKTIAFENTFIFEVSRKFHPIVKQATTTFGSDFCHRLIDSTPELIRRKIETLFEVKSSVAVWLR
jgi:hypothetical protein